ncbi:MAG TPA: hypothetical protein VIX19_08325 [Terriglobales bacterium]
MKSVRFMLSVVLMSLSTVAFAQSDAQMSVDKSAPSDAQKSFSQMKTLAGIWQGPVVVDPPQHGEMDGKPIRVTLRVTSRGNAIVHEMKEAGTPDDPAHYDDPITMLYLDGDRLLLTHYCDAGNRPRMTGKLSPDGKKVEFDFVDLAGGTEYGHMDHAVFTFIDANRHIEDWTYMMPGDKPMHAHFDLQRTK